MKKVYTIGYEGADISPFVETLLTVGITALADVRAVPISRKKGFSKTALRERLEVSGIRYEHFVELGDPKPGRDAARAGDYGRFRTIYGNHLRKNASLNALSELSALALTETVCLMCFERDPLNCHRLLIANHPTMKGFKITHLSADDPTRHVRDTEKRTSRHTREGATAAE